MSCCIFNSTLPLHTLLCVTLSYFHSYTAFFSDSYSHAALSPVLSIPTSLRHKAFSMLHYFLGVTLSCCIFSFAFLPMSQCRSTCWALLFLHYTTLWHCHSASSPIHSFSCHTVRLLLQCKILKGSNGHGDINHICAERVPLGACVGIASGIVVIASSLKRLLI